MVYLRVTTTLVEEKNVTAKSAASSLRHYSRNRSNRPRCSNLPPIDEEVDQHNPEQPHGWANGAKDGDLCDNLDNNRRARDTRSYIDQRHYELEERELRRRVEYDREYAPLALFTTSWSVRSATSTTLRINAK
jgi:hypothetical protein